MLTGGWLVAGFSTFGEGGGAGLFLASISRVSSLVIAAPSSDVKALKISKQPFVEYRKFRMSLHYRFCQKSRKSRFLIYTVVLVFLVYV